jgi:hypothetical protein
LSLALQGSCDVALGSCTCEAGFGVDDTACRESACDMMRLCGAPSLLTDDRHVCAAVECPLCAADSTCTVMQNMNTLSVAADGDELGVAAYTGWDALKVQGRL